MIETGTFYSEYLGEERKIYIYVPEGYGEDPDKNYPVLYMQDGQNIFSHHGEHATKIKWNMDKTAGKLIKKGFIEEIIIVGIANSEWRDDEYTPTVDAQEGSGGYADMYLKFLTEEVKGYIDEHFAVRPFREDTAIGGSSLGGLLSLYAAIAYPEYFGKVAAISPSIWWDNNIILDMAEEWDVEPDEMQIWMDMGLYEIDEEEIEAGEPHPFEGSRELCEILTDKGFIVGQNFHYYEDYWGSHDEISWGRRMKKVLMFLFGQ
ncbi:MAG: alpha/beta hydrolase-fold protein [Candidatus Eremiobacterota bacterium]